MELNERQKFVLYKLVQDLRSGDYPPPERTLGGYAGTGKSTLLKYLSQFFPNFAICAYTGKAANVLRKKGMMATTIHSRIYKPEFDNGQVYFTLAEDPGCDGFLVDEASMVSGDIYGDLTSYGLPMVFVGDHGQLEPVDSKFNLMEKPDYTLEEIHRNAGDIARFAESIRKGYNSRGFQPTDGSVEFYTERQISDELLSSYDQVLCAFNRTRVQLNNRIRDFRGFKGKLEEGERVMCLKNNRTHCIFNGLQGTVLRLYTKKYRKYMDLEADGQEYKEICYDSDTFGQESYKHKMGSDAPIAFDYAYASTVHKAQGDEWPSVLVWEQQCKNWCHRRWGYTGASRARIRLGWKRG